MSKKQSSDGLFCDFYAEWVKVYKEGAVRPITLNKYNMAHSWICKLAPDLKLGDLDRIRYQEIINAYAEKHERQTTMDFHHLIKGAILDAVDEGLIERDPTRKAIIKPGSIDIVVSLYAGSDWLYGVPLISRKLE